MLAAAGTTNRSMPLSMVAALPRLVTTARVPRAKVDELLTPRDGLVVEQRAGDGTFVAVDGPDERTAERAQRVKDSRLSVRVDPINRGTVTCMRRSLETTDSQLVARADADDISMPWRFR